MSLIRAEELGQDLEDKVAPNGRYDLRITSAKVKKSKDGERDMIAVAIAIEGGEGNYATVFQNVLAPKEADEPGTRRRMLRDWKRFMTVFGVPNNGTDIDEENASETLVGLTGNCQLVQEEMQDGNGNKTGEMRNVLRLPKIDG